jgi:hypothetical protein
METRPIVGGIDIATGEVFSREMNDEEFAQHLKDQADKSNPAGIDWSFDNATGLFSAPPLAVVI